MFLVFVLVIFLFPFVFGKGECYRTIWREDLQKHETEYYCCNDNEEINGNCIACKTGYTSTNGKKCEPCPDKNFYGIKCLSSCQCTDNQRCHHVEGCINLPSTTYHMTKEGHSTSASVITSIYEREKKEKSEQNEGLFTQQIIVYTMCIAGLLVVITICYVCAKHVQNRKTRNEHNENNNMNRKPGQIKLSSVPRELPNSVVFIHENEDQSERFYDEIKEVNVDETSASFKRNSITTDEHTLESSDCENDEKLEEDGYLNPYQQMVNDPDSHDYNFAIRKDKQSMKIQLQNSQEFEYIDAVSCNNTSETPSL